MASEAKIRTIIVDDEAPARMRLRQLLKDEADFEIVAECANGRQAVETIERERPDLVFLDVQMPRLSGLDVCEAVTTAGTPMPLVVFVTAYDEYALKAFEVHAIDYLLKPFDRERFRSALDQARLQLSRTGAGATDPRLMALLEELGRRTGLTKRLTYKENGRVIFIQAEAIDWIEADGNYLRIHTGKESHYVRETLSGLEARLPADRFMRISRSIIVNLERVKELQPHFYGDYVVVLHNGSQLNMSRNYRGRLATMLENR